MERSFLLINLIIRVTGKVASRPQERQHGHPIPTHRRLVAEHPDGEVVVHQIHTRMVMGEPLVGTLLSERRIHMVVMAARPPLGTPRRAPLILTRMEAKPQLGTPLHGHLIHTRRVVKPLRGMPPHGPPTSTLAATLRPGVMMAAEHLVRAGAEDGGVERIAAIHGEIRHLHGRLTRVTLDG